MTNSEQAAATGPWERTCAELARLLADGLARFGVDCEPAVGTLGVRDELDWPASPRGANWRTPVGLYGHHAVLGPFQDRRDGPCPRCLARRWQSVRSAALRDALETGGEYPGHRDAALGGPVPGRHAGRPGRRAPGTRGRRRALPVRLPGRPRAPDGRPVPAHARRRLPRLRPRTPGGRGRDGGDRAGCGAQARTGRLPQPPDRRVRAAGTGAGQPAHRDARHRRVARPVLGVDQRDPGLPDHPRCRLPATSASGAGTPTTSPPASRSACWRASNASPACARGASGRWCTGVTASSREHALDPRDYGLYEDEVYRRERVHPFTPDRELPWVWGYSLRDRRPVLVPEILAYFHAPGRPQDRFLQESSSGRQWPFSPMWIRRRTAPVKT